VAATTVSNSALTITRGMIAVNDLILPFTNLVVLMVHLVGLAISHGNLHLVKDVLVVILEREDAALLKNPAMKERETVMVH